MHFSRFTFLLIGLFSFFALITTSCKTKKSNDNTAVIHQDSLANFPYWIAMMNDPNTNYYQAVSAFDKYWEHREKPTEDNGEAKDIFEKDKSPEEKQKDANRSVEYVYEYKQFLHWKETNKNFVKPDGTIMTSEEVLEQWKKNNQR